MVFFLWTTGSTGLPRHLNIRVLREKELLLSPRSAPPTLHTVGVEGFVSLDVFTLAELQCG